MAKKKNEIAFDDLFFRTDFPLFRAPAFPRMTVEPVVDVFERPHEVVVTAELPGTRKEDIALKVTERGLQLHVHKREDQEERQEGKDGLSYLKESRFEGFSQFVAFSSEVKAEKARATYKNGVLEVRVPKRQGTKGHEVKVE